MEERKKTDLPEKPKTPQQLWYNHEKKAYMKLHPEVPHTNTRGWGGSGPEVSHTNILGGGGLQPWPVSCLIVCLNCITGTLSFGVLKVLVLVQKWVSVSAGESEGAEGGPEKTVVPTV